MILVLDNYDSFTYNLVHQLGRFTKEVAVFRNDKISLDEIEMMKPTGILISPGPGRPEGAGITCDVIRKFAGSIPVLGVCLGHQALGSVMGGVVNQAPTLMHGRTSAIHHTGVGLFKGIPNPFEATRYHSLIVERDTCPPCFDITAWTDDGVIMAIQHKERPLYGVQFHPESILTKEGDKIISNWIDVLQ